jgi:hypothetical protein
MAMVIDNVNIATTDPDNRCCSEVADVNGLGNYDSDLSNPDDPNCVHIGDYKLLYDHSQSEINSSHNKVENDHQGIEVKFYVMKKRGS